MRKRPPVLRGAILLAVASMLVSGAATAKKKPPPQPDYLDEAFSSSQVDRIAVLPVADLRLDKSIEMKKLNEIAYRALKGGLKKSPYTLTYPAAAEAPSDVTQENLDFLEESWVVELGDPDDSWVLLLVLQDIAKKKTYGSAYGAVCTGYLFDKKAGRPVWQHETVGTFGQGGLAGLAMKSASRGASWETCVYNLLLTFPERKKKK